VFAGNPAGRPHIKPPDTRIILTVVLRKDNTRTILKMY
jgi:hypothetical protein